MFISWLLVLIGLSFFQGPEHFHAQDGLLLLVFLLQDCYDNGIRKRLG